MIGNVSEPTRISAFKHLHDIPRSQHSIDDICADFTMRMLPVLLHCVHWMRLSTTKRGSQLPGRMHMSWGRRGGAASCRHGHPPGVIGISFSSSSDVNSPTSQLGLRGCVCVIWICGCVGGVRA